MQSLVETNSSPQQFGQIDRYSGNFLPLDSVQTENSVEDDVELKAKEVLRDPTFWEHATSQFDRCNDPIEEERKKRDELLDFLMERPAEALLSEATNFASIYFAD
ncbi:MAG: hypothetical protein ABIQ64_01150, partial [Candidatus Saccharimonadales bacterium]